MRLKPGAMRELHWHSLAAEWAYVLEGRCRATVVMPNGQSEIAEFVPGDTWYFPRGHGHALQAMDNDCHFLLGFDNGHFSEFGTFSITDWIANTPPEVLSRNLGLPASAFAQFPKKEVYIGPGKVPTRRSKSCATAVCSRRSSRTNTAWIKQPPRVFPGGREFMVSSQEFPIQTSLTAVRMDLQPGALREMHWHPQCRRVAILRARQGARPRVRFARRERARRSSVRDRWPSSSRATATTSSRSATNPPRF